MLAYERAMAPRLLKRMIDGDWEVIQCCCERQIWVYHIYTSTAKVDVRHSFI